MYPRQIFRVRNKALWEIDFSKQFELHIIVQVFHLEGHPFEQPCRGIVLAERHIIYSWKQLYFRGKAKIDFNWIMCMYFDAESCLKESLYCPYEHRYSIWIIHVMFLVINALKSSNEDSLCKSTCTLINVCYVILPATQCSIENI